jgi:phosphatidylserine/phosphatidylglycerophosphate/cardiolipin synthase-like enzyme
MIEKHLAESFQDFKLSQDEKYSLRGFLENLSNKNEMLAFARNKAFEIYREQALTEDGVNFKTINWLEKIIKTIDGVRISLSVAQPKSYFSPGDSCANNIIDCIQNAKQTVDICVFTISDNNISEAILSAHLRGIKVRVLSDNFKAEDRGSDIYYLAEKGVPVKLDRSPNHMHHKFAIFDQWILVNGSFNWTRSASKVNEENITVLYDASLLASFSETFESLWQKSERV